MANDTRYADDLAFSGDSPFNEALPGFRKGVAEIVEDEGFSLNLAKSRVMTRSGRQRVTGIVVNNHCNVGRLNSIR